MKNIIEQLSRAKLFYGIEADDIQEMFVCLNANIRYYKKGDIIHNEGDTVSNIGVVLSGSGHSAKNDPSGKKSIVTFLNQGDYIGILVAASVSKNSPVTVEAASDMSVMFFSLDNILDTCERKCMRHSILLRNFISGIAEKALHLHDRNDCLIKTTVREKILTFLLRVAKDMNSQLFTIPFDRNSMAEYLNVERSALSRELSRMKKDGLIDYYKSDFRIL